MLWIEHLCPTSQIHLLTPNPQCDGVRWWGFGGWLDHEGVHAKSLQSCPTLCNPMDCSPPGFSVHGDSPGKYWSGLACPSPGELPNPAIELESLVPSALTDTSPTWEAMRVRPSQTGSVLLFCKRNLRKLPFPSHQVRLQGEDDC